MLMGKERGGRGEGELMTLSLAEVLCVLKLILSPCPAFQCHLQNGKVGGAGTFAT